MVDQIVSLTFAGGILVQLNDLSGLDDKLRGLGGGPTGAIGTGARNPPGGGGGGGPPFLYSML